jgi:hypothetical protein
MVALAGERAADATVVKVLSTIEHRLSFSLPNLPSLRFFIWILVYRILRVGSI